MKTIAKPYWWFAGAICAITIVGIPWAKACFVIGQFAFLPFGKEAISRAELNGVEDIGTDALGVIGNILWFLVAGIWLAVGHVITACGALSPSLAFHLGFST